MRFDSPWSKFIRNNGAILLKIGDRPVNALAKVCEYVDFKLKRRQTYYGYKSK